EHAVDECTDEHADDERTDDERTDDERTDDERTDDERTIGERAIAGAGAGRVAAPAAAEEAARVDRAGRHCRRRRRGRRGHARARARAAGARHLQGHAARHGGLPMSHAPMRRALWIAALLAGCSQSGTGVELFIDAGSLTLDRLQIVASY